VSDDHTVVRATDPWEVAVSITHDGDTLGVTLDGDLAVTEIARGTPHSMS
jgi:hypothetical protein